VAIDAVEMRLHLAKSREVELNDNRKDFRLLVANHSAVELTRVNLVVLRTSGLTLLLAPQIF
jgi:hypothetical protein